MNFIKFFVVNSSAHCCQLPGIYMIALSQTKLKLLVLAHLLADVVRHMGNYANSSFQAIPLHPHTHTPHHYANPQTYTILDCIGALCLEKFKK